MKRVCIIGSVNRALSSVGARILGHMSVSFVALQGAN